MIAIACSESFIHYVDDNNNSKMCMICAFKCFNNNILMRISAVATKFGSLAALCLSVWRCVSLSLFLTHSPCVCVCERVCVCWWVRLSVARVCSVRCIWWCIPVTYAQLVTSATPSDMADNITYYEIYVNLNKTTTTEKKTTKS